MSDEKVMNLKLIWLFFIVKVKAVHRPALYILGQKPEILPSAFPAQQSMNLWNVLFTLMVCTQLSMIEKPIS